VTLQKAKTALTIKAKSVDFSFSHECYSFCKNIIAVQMAKERPDLAVAYLSKGLLAISNYADVQLRVIEMFAEKIGQQGITVLKAQQILALISQFAVVVEP
jgi:hypothetical protein